MAGRGMGMGRGGRGGSVAKAAAPLVSLKVAVSGKLEDKIENVSDARKITTEELEELLNALNEADEYVSNYI